MALKYVAGGVVPIAGPVNVEGCSVAVIGAGVVDITLTEGIDALECIPVITSLDQDNDEMTYRVQHTSDTVKRITFFEAGAAANNDFAFAFWRMTK